MNVGRVQLVWWGREGLLRWGLHRWVGGMAALFSWSLLLGPVEIRLWKEP